MTAVSGRPAYRVAFFLDEFGQLGRLDALVDSLTLMRGYGAQLWLLVQDLSQLKAVYPRWQSFLANTSQQYFGIAVGTSITARPPHRSVRAAFPHTAPTLGV